LLIVNILSDLSLGVLKMMPEMAHLTDIFTGFGYCMEKITRKKMILI